MPTIFDNIEHRLSDGLNQTLAVSRRADFCIGYFNLRGWGLLLNSVDNLCGEEMTDGEGNTDKYYARVLIGMQTFPHEELEEYFLYNDNTIDNKTAAKKIKQMALEFRKQLTIGAPTNQDENTLKKLSRQLHEKRVVVRLHLEFKLHAKLYLAYKNDYNSPIVGFLGSSNLTLGGISKQGELNVDVTDKDAGEKLEKWFTARWENKWSIDITEELAEIIDESWASEKLMPPYHVYMKMMYHLSQEALEGITEFNVPKIFRKELLPFQQNAVQIAAHHLYKRGGVMIGDVVGLGKTITAAALAKIFLDDFSHQSLILCPPNLKDMWQSYNLKYQLSAYIMSHGEVHKLADTIRYQIVIIDESHNFRNRSGKGYNAVLDYIDRNSSKVVLLTATPYNKSYLDMAGQLRLFVDEEADLGITPEQYIEKIGGPVQFEAQHQVKPNTLAAFEKSDLPDDWTDLMRLFLIRRTRSFIKKYYTKKDENGNVYLEFSDGRRQYFSKRKPQNVPYYFDVNDKTDQYAILYSESSVDIINNLHLARYGLGNKKYEDKSALKSITEEESKIKNNMSRAGKQLTGFARTNLFKRLESSGYSFLISICRHILRNYLFVFAMENNMPFPVGKQDGKTINDIIYTDEDFEEGSEKFITEINDYKKMAEDYYNSLQDRKERYEWIRSSLFNELLKKDLLEDCDELRKILYKSKIWKEEDDRQLNALYKLVTQDHADEKVLIFTEYSDTANYLFNALKRRGIKNIECATGNSHNTTELAWRFSPKSNEKKVDDEIRVLISTDVLSEGQNLQDAHIVVNYDLPWAIIRLIQRAGRVDRIGQQSDIINCYSFLPENGIETIINLRHRLKQRIAENAETVGSDEIFFPGDPVNIKDLYNEKSGIFDEEDQIDVDLSSYCYQIWRKGIEDNPTLTKIISSLPDVVYATKKTADDPKQMQGGVIVYAKTPDDNDNLTWIDENGKIVTQSYYRILRALECNANEEPLHRADNHHELVKTGLGYISENTKKIGGQLGRPTGARYRTYTRLTSWLEKNKETLFVTEEIKRAHQDIYEFPLQNAAKEALNRALKTGANDDDIASLVVSLRDQNKLSAMPDKEHIAGEPRIICSMGLKQG